MVLCSIGPPVPRRRGTNWAGVRSMHHDSPCTSNSNTTLVSTPSSAVLAAHVAIHPETGQVVVEGVHDGVEDGGRWRPRWVL